MHADIRIGYGAVLVARSDPRTQRLYWIVPQQHALTDLLGGIGGAPVYASDAALARMYGVAIILEADLYYRYVPDPCVPIDEAQASAVVGQLHLRCPMCRQFLCPSQEHLGQCPSTVYPVGCTVSIRGGGRTWVRDGAWVEAVVEGYDYRGMVFTLVTRRVGGAPLRVSLPWSATWAPSAYWPDPQAEAGVRIIGAGA